MNVVILESLGVSPAEMAARKAPFEKNGVVFTEYPKTTDKCELIREAQNAEVMILANMPMPAEVIRACPKLRFIDVAFTGVDHVGLEAARERKIAVSNASGYSTEAVSELVLGMVLSMARNLRAVEDRCRSGGTKDGLVGWEIKGKTVGIVGLGKIGTRSAELFHAFGAKLLSCSRTVHPDAPDFVEQVSPEKLLRESDVVVLHCPLNDSTLDLIDAEKLSWMKPTSLLVNAARGPVVNEDALEKALAQGQIAGACLDVFAKEPPLDPLSPALNAPHTLVTPHVAFATRESMSLRAEIVFENLRAWIDGNQKNVILP